MENNLFTSSAFSTDILDMIQLNGGYDNIPDLSQLITLPPDFGIPIAEDNSSSPPISPNSDEKEVEPKPKDRKMFVFKKQEHYWLIRKRREIVRKSETKRRERFKSQLDTLKDILFNHEQLIDMRKEKVTREDVLDK